MDDMDSFDGKLRSNMLGIQVSLIMQTMQTNYEDNEIDEDIVECGCLTKIMRRMRKWM